MAVVCKDATIPDNSPKTLLLNMHSDYISKYGNDPDEYEYAMSEFLRMNGIYWGVAAMDIMGKLETMDKDSIKAFLVACQDSSGGFKPVEGHDPHLLNTLSAVQVAAIFDCFDIIDTDGVVNYIVGLQQEDGSFIGDKWGEVDNRFCFCRFLCQMKKVCLK